MCEMLWDGTNECDIDKTLVITKPTFLAYQW